MVHDMWIKLLTAKLLLRASIFGFVSLAAISIVGASDRVETENALCLRGNNLQRGVACRNSDESHIGENPEIRHIIEIMGLAQTKILFAGCENGLFMTSPVISASPPSYLISYPVSHSRGDTSQDFAREYLAPITHELAHVLQLETRGGMRELTKNGERKMLSIELGADFISGIVFARTQAATPAALNSYQQNLKLVGLYKESNEAAHGTWEQRTTAFRFGAFLKPNPKPVNFRDADMKFEAIFPRVLNQGQFPFKQLPAIQWNRMSSCEDVEMVYQRLKRHSKVSLSACRDTHNLLESGISRFTIPPEIGRVCFLSESPAPFTDGFSCYQQPGQYNAVLCIRPTNPKEIEEHRTDQNTAIGANYMAQTAACGPHVDSSVALPTVTPWAVSRVAKHEFGFVRSLGQGQPADGMMVHGVATINKPESYGGITTIEYISMFSATTADDAGSQKSKTSEPKKYGQWVVELDDHIPYNAELNHLLRVRKLPAWVMQRALSITRDPESKSGSTTREAQIQRWQRILGEAFTDEGFKSFPLSELKDERGRGVLDLFRELQTKNSDGLASLGEGAISTSMLILFGQKGLACAVHEPDGIMGFIFSTAINDQDLDNFGTIIVTAVGLGNCGAGSPASKAYINELLENSVDGLLTTLKDRK